MTVTDYITALAPAYLTDSRIASFTAMAMQRTSASAFGCNYLLAVALRICHMIARNPMTEPGTPGAVSSATEGAVSQSYSISEELKRRYPDLVSTPYGAQLAELIDGNTIGIVVAGGPMAGSSLGIPLRR